jgi:hypothetical protein
MRKGVMFLCLVVALLGGDALAPREAQSPESYASGDGRRLSGCDAESGAEIPTYPELFLAHAAAAPRAQRAECGQSQVGVQAKEHGGDLTLRVYSCVTKPKWWGLSSTCKQSYKLVYFNNPYRVDNAPDGTCCGNRITNRIQVTQLCENRE